MFSVPQALQLGQFVLAAYDLFAESDPSTFVPPAGYSLVSKVYADDVTDDTAAFKVFGFIAQRGADVVVAIRGTEGVLEWIRDFEFALVRLPFVNAGMVEQGFDRFYSSFRSGPNNDAQRVVDALAKLIAGGTVKTLRIAGHSLGSALATLLAIDLAANGGFTTPVVYTFASPRIGDKVFAGTYDRLIETSWRIANLNDIVTQLPPQLVGYTHVDAEFPINLDDRCKHNFKCWHSLETYLNTLDASVPLDPACVP
ncbi:MAG: lipase family protein [Thermoguttaceae bacterium]|jgi:predicted lipase